MIGKGIIGFVLGPIWIHIVISRGMVLMGSLSLSPPYAPRVGCGAGERRMERRAENPGADRARIRVRRRRVSGSDSWFLGTSYFDADAGQDMEPRSRSCIPLDTRLLVALGLTSRRTCRSAMDHQVVGISA